jgi:hypothetical protein
MSYTVLGISCKSNKIACTSNHKFLPLRDSMYLKQDTYMMQYPGNSILTSTLPIKSYYEKIDESQPAPSTCKNC